MWNEVNQRELEEDVYFPVKCSKQKIEELVEFYRLHLYGRDRPCGAEVLRNKLGKLCVKPLPSVSTIGRILSRLCLTHKRTGYYEEDHTIINSN